MSPPCVPPAGAPAGKANRGGVIEVAVVVAAVATIPVTVAGVQGVAPSLVAFLDWAIWAVFVLDLVAGLATSAGRRDLRRSALAAAIVVLSFPLLPDVLAFARLARLARVVRTVPLVRVLLVSSRGFHGLRAVLGRKGLRYVASVSVLLVVAGGGALCLLEPERVEGGRFLAGVWWAIVTASTVGYGDIAPNTPGGRLVAVVVMLAGIGLISTLAASITAYFVERDEADKLRALTERLDGIEALLRDLARQPPDAAARRRDVP